MTFACLRNLSCLFAPAALLALGCGREPDDSGESDGSDTEGTATDTTGGDGSDTEGTTSGGGDSASTTSSQDTNTTGPDCGPIQLADIAQGIGGFAIDGEAAGDWSGYAVSGAGDVNDDGLPDFIVAAPWADPTHDYSGRSYVVFGKTDTAMVALADIAQGIGGFAMDGEAEQDESGRAVSGAGDVNGDGLADLVIGAYMADPNGSSSGRTYMVFGKTSTGNVSLADVAQGIGGFALSGEAEDHLAGISVSAAGDVNGDGLADIIMGAPGAGPNGVQYSGRAYVVLGRQDTDPLSLQDVALGIGGFVINGESENDGAGGAVDGAGDVNGDGLADVIVAAHWADPNGDASGRTYVVFGKADTDSVALADVTLGIGGFALDGEAELDFSGGSVSAAGDVNGDGLADVVVGAGGADPDGIACGRAYVVFGKVDTALVALADIAQGIGGFAIDGETEGDLSYSVSGAGDINGDGLADVLVGTYNASPPGLNLAGRTYVVFGKAETDKVQLADVTLGIGGFAIDGEAQGDRSGKSVSSAGDINGDGLADVVVGAYWADPNDRERSGRAYVVFGGDFSCGGG